jgi:Ca2+-binding RTX toxin-like protein
MRGYYRLYDEEAVFEVIESIGITAASQNRSLSYTSEASSTKFEQYRHEKLDYQSDHHHDHGHNHGDNNQKVCGCTDPECTLEHAENNSVSNAIPGDNTTTERINVGDQVNSVIDYADDTDWFAITLTEGQTVDISQMGAGGGTLVDPWVQLFDENSQLLATNDDIISGVRDSLITFTANTTGTYFISAEAWSTETGSYTLTVTLNTDAALDYTDSVSTTGVANVNGTVSGRLGTTTDSDWYAITLEAGFRYKIDENGVGADALEDGVLSLRDEDGNVIATNDNSGIGSNASLGLDINSTGTYYIEVSSNSQDGDYALSVEAMPQLEERTIDEIANFLTDEFSSRSSYSITTINYNLDGLSAGAAILASRALQAWADITPLTFIETDEASAQMVFTSNRSGAFNSNTVNSNGIILSSVINVSADWNGGNLGLDSYTYQTYLHEIGHALGLGHAGPYNGNAEYGLDNAYLNDSWAFTVMSYFSQRESGYFGDTRFVLGPQIADIVAIQDLYGANATTREGDTVYGFNSTLELDDVLNFDNPDLSRGIPSLSLFDTGGIDTLDISGYSANARINLNSETFSDINGIDGVISISRGTNIENAVGGTGDDTLLGNDLDNVLTGGMGNDFLDGGAGLDTAIFTLQYSDYTILELETGNLQITATQGSEGVDELASIEFLQFSDQTVDASIFNAEASSISGTPDADTLQGTSGDDYIAGFAGNDRLYGNGGADTLVGGEGLDRAYYTTSSSGVRVDFLTPSTNTGDAAGDSFDSIESIFGSVYNDVLLADHSGIDLVGLAGNDVLVGRNGRDRLFGGDGDDRLDSGRGNDDMHGNAGADTFVINVGAGRDKVYTWESGVDRIEFRGGPGDFSDLDVEIVGSDTVITHFNGVTILVGYTGGVSASDFVFLNPLPEASGTSVTTDLTAGNDTQDFGIDNDTVNGLAGNDILRGGIGDDTLNGGDGNDQLFGGLGADVLDGGEGNDRASYTTASSGVTVNLLNASLNTGEAAGDTFISIENIYGSIYDDVLVGDAGDNDLIGLGGNDQIIGTNGDDRLYGNEGDDRLTGGRDDDDLFGGDGNDTFVFGANSGSDRIYGFEDGNDIIEFQSGPGSINELTITFDGTNSLITYDNRSIELIDFDATALTAADFVFTNAAGVAAKPAPGSTKTYLLDTEDYPEATSDPLELLLSQVQSIARPIIADFDNDGILDIMFHDDGGVMV